MKYVVALLAIALGSLLVIYTEWFIQNFGTSSWAEAKGIGSRFLYKLVGLGIILISLLGISGLLGKMILGIFGSLFGV